MRQPGTGLSDPAAMTRSSVVSDVSSDGRRCAHALEAHPDEVRTFGAQLGGDDRWSRVDQMACVLELKRSHLSNGFDDLDPSRADRGEDRVAAHR